MMKRSYFLSVAGIPFDTQYPQWHKEDKPISKAEFLRLREEYSRNELLKLIKPKSTVYTLLRHVSNSGMSRRISCFIVDGGSIRCIDGYVSDLTGYKQHANKAGLIAGGCGMDMGFAIVYALGGALWPNGTEEPHGMRNGEPDIAGGYAIKQSWL